MKSPKLLDNIWAKYPEDVSKIELVLKCAHADLTGMVERFNWDLIPLDEDIKAAKKTIKEIEEIITI